jgi:hypothetical protein
MTRCRVVTLTVNGETGTVRAQVHDDYGPDRDAAALAEIIRAGHRAWALTSHPEPLTVTCPRCGARAGEPCTATGGAVLPWAHRERHAKAITADGRTCTGEGVS